MTHPARRNTALDAAKGVGITLMVFGHVYAGVGRYLPVDNTVLHWTTTTLHTCRMPLFFVIAGLFLPQAVRKRGLWAFTAARTRTLLWPFVVWSVISGLLGMVMADQLAGGGTSWTGIVVSVVWDPAGHFWYLPALLLSMVTVAALHTAAPARGRIPLLLGVTAAMWVVGGWVTMGPFGFLDWAIYVAAGVAARDKILALTGCRARRLALVAAAAGTVFVAAVVVAVPAGWVDYEITPAFLACAVFGTITLLAVGVLTGRMPGVGAVAAFVGARTLHIYLLHVIFSSAGRVGLRLAGVEGVPLLVAAGTVIGVGGPLLVAAAAERGVGRFLFELPPLRRAESRHRAARAPVPQRPGVDVQDAAAGRVGGG